MSMYFIIAILIVVFIGIDLLTAKVLKIKRSLMRNISLIVLCIAAVIFIIAGTVNAVQGGYNDMKFLYNAYSYLIDGDVEKAEENAEKVDSPHSDMIMLLSQCLQGNYSNVFIISDDLLNSGRLNTELYEQANVVYEMSRRMTGLEGSPLTDSDFYDWSKSVARSCFSLLNVDENTSVIFLTGYSREKMLNSDDYYNVDYFTLMQMLEETPDDSELLRFSVKYYNSAYDFVSAEQYAMTLLEKDRTPENIVLYSETVAQSMLNDTYYNAVDGSTDSEIAELLNQALLAEQAAGYYSYGDPLYEENMNRAEYYRNQVNAVRAKRIINWLTMQIPLFGDSSGLIDLQLSRLYCAAGEDEKALDTLFDLIRRVDSLDADSSFKEALKNFRDVYYNTNASDSEITSAINELLHVNGFLSDSTLSRGYYEFLNRTLKYERISIFISRVAADNYPTVRVYLNVNGRKDGRDQLADDFTTEDFSFNDNGTDIPISDVTRIEDEMANKISIALVIDGSGSMDGDRIENARRAVRACIENMDSETQELSIVIYENSARTITPLTNDTADLFNGAAQIDAAGGTVISSGLFEGIASLDSALGTKAIILMTDGEDGSPETIDAAITAAQEANVSVFTVSTGGGDREYMENIAKQTGGTYMEAVTDAELIDVYTSLQSYIVNNYCFEYTLKENTEANPRLLTVSLNDYNVSSSRTYAHSGMILAADGSYIYRADESTVSLLYAEPSAVSVKDAQLGIPIFITGSGFADGTRVFVNGLEVNVNTVGDTVLTFILQGDYTPGALDISVNTPAGITKTSSTLLSISSNKSQQAVGRIISLGGGRTLYADSVEQQDSYTLLLSGNVTLNGYIHTDGDATLSSSYPITAGSGTISVQSGYINGYSPAYIDHLSLEGYGQTGAVFEVMDYFGFYFDEYSINSSGYANIDLPGLGIVYCSVEFDGTEFNYTSEYSANLTYLQQNLDYAFNNNTSAVSGGSSGAIDLIAGNSYNNYYDYGVDTGLYANAEHLSAKVGLDKFEVSGYGEVNGSFGVLDISGASLLIDSSDPTSLFSIEGELNAYNLNDSLGIENYGTFSIGSKGIYPDSIYIDIDGFIIEGSEISDCFLYETLPEALDTDIRFDYVIGIENEPYGNQMSPLLDDIFMNCDKLRFIYDADYSKRGMIIYNSADPDKYVMITYDSIVVPINNVNEVALFGSRLGGEIQGTAFINSWSIQLDITADGHLDNAFYDIGYDGIAALSVRLSRNAYKGDTVDVKLTYGTEAMTYNATVLGGVVPQNGFSTWED